MTYGSAPVIAGVTFRRPSSVSESPESLRRPVVLAGGGLRAYDGGIRDVFELSWSRLTEAERDALVAVCASAFVTYTHVDGTTQVVETNPPEFEPIAGTDPVRFSASVTLRGQDPR